MQVSRVLPMSLDYSVTYVPDYTSGHLTCVEVVKGAYGCGGCAAATYEMPLQLNFRRQPVTGPLAGRSASRFRNAVARGHARVHPQ